MKYMVAGEKKKKKEVVSLKGNCRTSIGGSLPHPEEMWASDGKTSE